ncbi:uncharacterized protein SAPINGB_P002393 [Magnusiomyces paraingens]|uniref:chitin synthase n=1 Tax=Magnusiomyces paraingens TaxID=2606893 RepID=A0A5E8BJG9_9ASCO|nr:uncharacterized protein SAPINGB_P002393 [Saprochaete ingens]VVT49687.1 unnamed protein product [Saprochaete ingens]
MDQNDPYYQQNSPTRQRYRHGSPTRNYVPLDSSTLPHPIVSPALPSPSRAAYNSRQSYHLDELTNSNLGGYQSEIPDLPQIPPIGMPAQTYTPSHSPTRAGAVSPSRSPTRSPTRSMNNMVHGSPKRRGAETTPRALWTRLESPARTADNTPIVIDDDDDDNDNNYANDDELEIIYEQDGNPRHSTMDSYGIANTGNAMHRATDSNATAFADAPLLPPPNLADDGYSYLENDESQNTYADPTIEQTPQSTELRSAPSSETLSSNAFEVPVKAQPRRNKSMARREVKLVRGNLVLDCPVPTKLYSFLPRRDHDEFVYMRYSAVTTDPNDFVEGGFNLRPAIYERETQLCICITMYNEDETHFTRTMHSVMKNIGHLVSRKNSPRHWGKDSWKKVVVCIVADGRSKVSPGVLNVLSAMGVFQEGIAKNYVNGKEVQAHIFEYTTQVSLDPDLTFQGAEKGIVPVQVMFCLKEKNAKKINSHRWLFNAFCPVLNPAVCVLLDVGTKPGPTSIYNLWKAFDSDSNIGGACGEIRAMTGPQGRHLLNPLVAAQNFEYKMSNILDKPLESAFGYITVLPGALSAYRYIALKNGPDGKGPLAQYFKGEFLHGSEADVFTSNMYLAEDRILCWELVAKRGEKWLLKYVRSANGETDVPDDVPEFISQRRRWLNGALFAAVYAQTHFTQIWQTDHSLFRKILLHIEFAYQFLQLLFTFFSVANFYLAFYFVAGSLSSSNDGLIPSRAGFYLFLLFKYIFLCTLAAQFIISLGNRPQGSRHWFYASFILLGIVGLYAIACGLYFVARTVQQHGNADLGNNAFTNILVSMISTYGLYVVMSVLYLDPWHIITSSIQYFLLLPGYTITLQIYALCNTHDVTWGTKGDNEQKMDLGSAVVKAESGNDIVEMDMPAEQFDIDQLYEEALSSLRDRKMTPEAPPAVNKKTMVEDYYREFRTRVVLFWMIANMILALLMMQVFSLDNTNGNVYLKIILWSVAALAGFRALGSLAYLVQITVKYLYRSRDRTFRRNNLTGK